MKKPPTEGETRELGEGHYQIWKDNAWHDLTGKDLTIRVLQKQVESDRDLLSFYNIKAEVQAERIKELEIGLQEIEMRCDNQNPTHEAIWRIANELLKQTSMDDKSEKSIAILTIVAIAAVFIYVLLNLWLR